MASEVPVLYYEIISRFGKQICQESREILRNNEENEKTQTGRQSPRRGVHYQLFFL